MKKVFRLLLFPWSWKNFALFVLFWLFLGFSTGFSVLMGPLRDVVEWVKSHNFGLGFENLLARIVMFLFVVGSALIAGWFVRLYARTRLVHVKLFLILFSVVAGGSSAYMMINPAQFQIVSGDINTFNAQFGFGGYPTEEKMRQLRREGYTGIISLLSPTLPPEKVLLEKEKIDAQKAGIHLYHLPMLPWLGSSSNEESLDRVRELAQDKSGRYYVHCYLGMDRAGLVMRVVEESSDESKLIATPQKDNLASVRSMVRGPICRLDEGVYVTPLPSQSEIIRYIIGSNVRQMISLLDPNDSIRAGKEEAFIKSYHVPFRALPISMEPYDPIKMLEIAREAAEMPRPLVVYTYDVFSPRAQAFFQSFRLNKPALPEGLFQRPLSFGQVYVTRTNVAVGPMPTRNQMAGELYAKGIRSVIEVSLSSSAHFKNEVTGAGLTYFHTTTPSGGYQIAEEGGPYYMTGPRAPTVTLAALHQSIPQSRRLDVDIYLFPADERLEIKRYLATDGVKQVLCLQEEGKKVEVGEAQIKAEGVGFEEMTFSKDRFDAQKMLFAARRVWKLPKPLVILYPADELYLQEGMIQAFTTDLAPTPPELFQEENEEVIGPNVVVSKTDEPGDLRQRYTTRGISKFMYLGNPLSQQAGIDRREAFDAGLDWDAYRLDRKESYLVQFFEGGPWMIYGPGIELNLRPIEKVLEPALPRVVLSYPQNGWTGIKQLKSQLFARSTVAIVNRFTDRYLPSKETVILLAPFLILYTMVCGSFVGYLRDKKQIRTSYTRKMYHFLIFTLAGFLQLSVNIPGLALFGCVVACGVVYGALRGNGCAFYEALARDSDEQYKKAFVLIPLALTAMGGVLSYFLFGSFVVVGIFVVGFGDAVGEVTGAYIGHHQYRSLNFFGLGANKTLEGSAAIAIASTLAAILGLGFLGAPAVTILWLAPFIGVVSAVVEGVCIRAVDNFIVMVLASGIAYLLA